MMSKMDRLYKHVRSIEKALCTIHPGVSSILEQPDEVMQGMKEEEEDDDLDHDMKRLAKRPTTETNGVNSTRSEPEFDGEVDDSDDGSEGQVAGNVPPGEPAIPIGHTTGAAKILQWPAVAAMVGDKMKKDKNRGIDPLRREIRRGVIRLYWRGEGVERSVGHDKDSLSDYSLDPPRSSSDTYSEAAHSPAVEQPWALGGEQSPVADSYLFKAESEARAAVDLSAAPQLDERTVRRLSQSYMRYLNVMHPIITQKALEGMVANFMQQIGGESEKEGSASNFSSFISSETVGAKRKRSPTVSSADNPYALHLNHGRRHRSISEAIVLLILALGKICEHQSKIPDVVPDNDVSTSNSPLNPFSPLPMHQSPQLSSHSSALPSPIMQDRAHHRRSSTDASGKGYPPFTRNLDVIPGLAYFAIATDILGNHAGGTGLPYVHACLLASLYHSQLGRVLQSHAFVKEAGYALTIMLKQ
jgi:hypothetical protein